MGFSMSVAYGIRIEREHSGRNKAQLPSCNGAFEDRFVMSEALHIVCPHCNAVNRVPDAKLGQKPKCGQCHQELFTGQPVALTGATFQTQINRNDIPLLVDFWAPWWGPCLMMAPQYEQAAGLLEPRGRLAMGDTEAEPRLGAQFNIRSVPTLALFKGGREAARQSGAMGSADIVRWVQSRV
jgi:thioredoxin 2